MIRYRPEQGLWLKDSDVLFRVEFIHLGFLGMDDAKRRGLAESIVGIGRSRKRLEAARSSGLVDVVSVEGST